MTVKERIIIYINSKGISPHGFEVRCGLSNGYLRQLRNSPTGDKIEIILATFPDLDRKWLMTGEGEMLVSAKAPAETKEDTRPRIPVAAAAGTLAGFAAAVKAEDCEMVPVIKAFPSYDYTMIVKGNSMEPKYEGGDEIAIRRVSSTIEWGKTYVLDTRDGAVIKRLYDAGDQFRCVSYNAEYPDFYVDKSEVFGVYKVVGLIRI